MVSFPTARGEVPRFYELDPLRFQSMCRDLYQAEPGIATAEVFGVSGQPQFGVDIVATCREGGGVEVGQSKCIEPDSLSPALVRKATQEFLKHLSYWQERNTQRFILFVAPDSSERQIQEELLRQRDEFLKVGIKYELWGASTIANKLRPHTGITETYLGSTWKDILCGSGVSGLTKGSVVVNSVLTAQLEVLADRVSTAAEVELENLRNAWRRGHRSTVITGIARLRETGSWQALSPKVQASILRFEGHLALEKGDLPRAKQLADESSALDTTSNVRLRALIARAENHSEISLSLLESAADKDSQALRAALIMEEGRFQEALPILAELTGYAEAHRLRALAFMLQGDMPTARLEAEKAVELAGMWHANLYTKAMIYYLSGLSPAALPRFVPPWPEPLDWHLVKTDDQSRGFFATAATTVARIETEAEATAEERRIHETWHLASLANDPERRDEATAYCRELLRRDPTHYQAIAWASARRLDVDLSEPEISLRALISLGKASPAEMIVLTLIHLQRGEFQTAKSMLEDNKRVFDGSGAIELWQFWMAQLAAAKCEELSSQSLPSEKSKPREVLLLELRATARSSGNWEPVISELRTRAVAGDNQAAFELCDVLASLQKWDEALPFAETVAERIETTDAVMLACTVLYNTKHFDRCLEGLESHRNVFPHAQFPTRVKYLRLAAQRELGLLPAAIADGEDLFRSEPSEKNFVVLSDLYFEKGDFASLAVLARKHQEFENLSSTSLLRLSMRVAAEDKAVADELWRRASAKGFLDDEVLPALELGYKLGLDPELRSLIQRLPDLAAKPERRVRQMDIDQVREHLLERRSDVERIFRMYAAGEIPIHFVAEHLNRPLAFWYHRVLLENEASGEVVAGPCLIRSGWRVGQSITLRSGGMPRLHADLTSILLAFHLGILEKIEGVFRPIVLPYNTVIALAVMRDALKPGQPSRVKPLQIVQDLVARNVIQIDDEAPAGDAGTIPLVAARSAQMLVAARHKGWLIADFLPLRDEAGQVVTSIPGYEDLIRTAHTLVEALRLFGEISETTASLALDALGPEHGQPSNREVPKGSTVLCSAGVLTLLASGGTLEVASRVFSLRMTRWEFDTFVLHDLLSLRATDEDAHWLTGLIDRINRGIDSGAYRLLPALDATKKRAKDVADGSPAVSCLLDILHFAPKDGDVIWVDDRWLNGFAHRDGIPIIGTVDILHMLRDLKVLSNDDLHQHLHRLRESDARLLSLDKAEIRKLVLAAGVKDGQILESRELRTLRRYYARSLAAGEVLRVLPSEQGRLLEWPFILTSGASAADSIVELWEGVEARKDIQAVAEWVLANLFTPDRGRSFTKAERSAELDFRLEAVSLSSLLAHSISFGSVSESREARKEYLEWIYQRLLRQRFEADPNLATATLDIFKANMRHAMEATDEVRKHPRLASAVMQRLFMDLPEELGDRIAEDGDFVSLLGISRHAVVHVGPHRMKAEDLWGAAARAVQSRESIGLKVGSTNLFVKVHDESGKLILVVEDRAANMNYVLPSELTGVLSDSVVERETSLRRLAHEFDLPKASTEEAIARIASLGDACQRATEVANLRARSAYNDYVALESRLKERQPIEESDHVPQDIETIVRHLRFDVEANQPLVQRLDSAAVTLLSEVGLEEAIDRLSGVPIPLPVSILSAVEALPMEDRRQLLKRRIRVLGRSPLSNAHLAYLLARFASERPSYARYLRMTIGKFLFDCDNTKNSAWLRVLRVIADRLCYLEAFRRMPTDTQLCIAWAHGDRLFRIFASVGVNMDWIAKHFGSMNPKLPAETGFAKDDYISDVAHPERISELTFSLATCAYASEHGLHLDEGLRATISHFVESEPARIVEVMCDLGLGNDVMGSIMRYGGQAAWLSIFSDGLRDQLSSVALRPQILAATESIKSQPSDVSGWSAIHAIVRDGSLPVDLVPSFREALLATNLSVLHDNNTQAALMAAIICSRGAGRLGEEAVGHIREQIIALARAWNRSSQRSPVEIDYAVGALLSAAFYLYIRGEAIVRAQRFAEIASLLEAMVQQWPALLERTQVMVDRLIEGLPNADSRWMWQLQVKLRALR